MPELPSRSSADRTPRGGQRPATIGHVAGRWPIVAAALAAFAWLAFSIGLRPLNLPEEGRYVGVAWEMLRSGNWLVPTENGLPFFHKPPLFYWLTAASMRVFGTAEWATRLAPLLAASLGAVVLHAVARRWAGEAVARWSVAVLVTVPFFFAGAQFANLDMLVAACIAATILLAAHATLLARNGERCRGVVVAAWAVAALGVLAKGLIGVALPGLVMLVWLIGSGQARMIGRLLALPGLVAFIAIAAPWFIAVQAEFPGFARFFFVYQQFERFTAGGFNAAQPWWFFAAVVPLLTLPWSLWLIGSRLSRRVADVAASDRMSASTASAADVDARLWRGLLWTWLAVVLLFFSIPRSKPFGYAMPVLFPIAALVADVVVARLASGHRRARLMAFASVGVAAVVCLTTVIVAANTRDRDNSALGQTLAQLRAPGDPVLFVAEYFFDLPLYARLQQPVAVASDWSDPDIQRRDNWRRELAEAAPFAPALAAASLVDIKQGFALRCGPAPLWVVVKQGAEAGVAALPGARRAALSNGVALWRIAPGACSATASGPTPKVRR